MKTFKTLIAIALFTPVLTTAQVGQNAKEKKQDKKEIKKNKKYVLRDQQELNQFKIKAREYQEADSLEATLKLKNLHRGIIADMEREIDQTTVKINEAKKEVASSKQEVRSDNREIRKDKKDLAKRNGDHRDDKRDLARDKKDRRDDIRDTNDCLLYTSPSPRD